MSGKRESNPISMVLDWIKHTVDKIKPLLIALGALITATVPIYKFVIEDPAPPPRSIGGSTAALTVARASTT